MLQVLVERKHFLLFMRPDRSLSIDINWWLVRVTLVVDWLFFALKFWCGGGDLRKSFAILWMYMGWWIYFQVVGTPLHYLSEPNFLYPQVVGTLKPSTNTVRPPHPLAPLRPLDEPPGETFTAWFLYLVWTEKKYKFWHFFWKCVATLRAFLISLIAKNGNFGMMLRYCHQGGLFGALKESMKIQFSNFAVFAHNFELFFEVNNNLFQWKFLDPLMTTLTILAYV